LAALPLAGHHEPRQRHGVTPLAAVRHDRPSGETSDARGGVSVTRVCSPAPPPVRRPHDHPRWSSLQDAAQHNAEQNGLFGN